MNITDKWIQDVENSLNGIQQADVNPYLYSKIINRINAKVEVVMPVKWAWISVASLFAMIIINVSLLKFVYSNPKSNNSEIKQLSNKMNLINDNQINYNNYE